MIRTRINRISVAALAAIGPSGTPARAIDGTWTGPGAEWTTGMNWSSTPAVPDSQRTPTALTISSSASINTIQFDAGAPDYFFTNSNNALFAILGTGVVNNSANSPSFINNSFLGFFNSNFAGRVHRAVPPNKTRQAALRRRVATRDQARRLPHHCPQDGRADKFSIAVVCSPTIRALNAPPQAKS
jgi:hypothetical protein